MKVEILGMILIILLLIILKCIVHFLDSHSQRKGNLAEILEALQLADLLGKISRDIPNMEIIQQDVLNGIIKSTKWRAQN